MAKYGYNKYGSGFKYGELASTSAYYSSGLTVWAYDYGTNVISWGPITPDPSETSPTHWKLVKSYVGSLDNPDDGIMLAGGAYTTITSGYTDTNYVEAGYEVLYSLWVFNGLRWINCGEDYEVAVPLADTGEMVSRWLPKAWLNPVDYVGEALGENNQDDFLKTLNVLSFYYDKMRTEAAILHLSPNTIYTPSALLKYKINELGFEYEASLGDTYHRTLYGTGAHVNASKGTSLGVSVYTTALTHWANNIAIGHNLMLDYNDSSFEESTGRWVASSGTFIAVKHAIAGLSAPTSLVYDPLFQPRTIGFGRLKTAATTAVTLSLPGAANQVITSGIVVEPNNRYILTGWVKHYAATASITAASATGGVVTYTANNSFAAGETVTIIGLTTTAFNLSAVTIATATATQFTVTNAATGTAVTGASGTATLSASVSAQLTSLIKWYDKFGNLLSTTMYGSTYATTTSWQEFRTGSNSGRNGFLSPVTAARAQIILFVTPSTSAKSTYAFDMLQFAPSEKSFEYQDAKQVTIYAKGQKENYISNPGFENGTGGWSAYNGQLYADGTNTSAVVYETKAGRLQSTANGTAAFVTDWIPVDPGKYLTFSAYVEGSAARTAIARIEFSTPTDADDQTTILSDVNGQYYSSSVNYVDSVPITLSTTSSTEISVSALSPAYTQDSGNPVAKISVYFTNNVASDRYWLDAAILEESIESSTYFSGSGGPDPVDPTTEQYYSLNDCLWEKKTRFNFAANPIFATNTTDYTSSGTLTRVATDNSLGPIDANTSYFGKVAYTGPSASITGVVYLPWVTLGGESVVVSMYVRGGTLGYTLGTTSVTVPDGSVTWGTTSQQNTWTRISNVYTMDAGVSFFNWTLTGSVPGSGAAYYHISSVQAEWGRIPTQFINPSVATSIPYMPVNPSKTILSVRDSSSHGGKGLWYYNYGTKLSRLNKTLPLILPNGSSFAIVPGTPSGAYKELSGSLIPNASFEETLGGWSTTNSVVSRRIASGSLSGDNVTHGQAYARVITSGSSGNATFSIASTNVYIDANSGYYTSVAIKPINSNSTGSYTLRTDFYTVNGTLIPVYTDNITGQPTSKPNDSSGTANTVVVTTANRAVTKTVTDLTRWAYIADTYSVSTIIGAYYAVVTVTFSPATYTAGQGFDIDRVIFRQ
jgi:hypothetical protein